MLVKNDKDELKDVQQLLAQGMWDEYHLRHIYPPSPIKAP